jgi:hypothetical protein
MLPELISAVAEKIKYNCSALRGERSALQAFSTAARSAIIMPSSRQRLWPEAISASFPWEKWQFCS